MNETDLRGLLCVVTVVPVVPAVTLSPAVPGWPSSPIPALRGAVTWSSDAARDNLPHRTRADQRSSEMTSPRGC